MTARSRWRILGAVSTVTPIPLEAPVPVRPGIGAILAVGLGTYLLLFALAIAENRLWTLALVPAAVVCFALAGRELYALFGRR